MGWTLAQKPGCLCWPKMLLSLCFPGDSPGLLESQAFYADPSRQGLQYAVPHAPFCNRVTKMHGLRGLGELVAELKSGFEHPRRPCTCQPKLRPWRRPHLLSCGQDKQLFSFSQALRPLRSLSHKAQLPGHIWRDSRPSVCHP